VSAAALREADAALAALAPLPAHLPLGGTAPVVAGAFTGIGAGRWAAVGPRHRVGAVLRGCRPDRLRDPADGARPWRLLPVSGAPGARALHAVGAALAGGEPVLCLLGPASLGAGAVSEALQAAALTSARVVFVAVLPRLPADAPVAALPVDPAALAMACGVPCAQVSGFDEARVAEAVAAAAATSGPSLVCVRA
jgi:thiamine pyrophosphate-dependent acetolactate synthase large subunit-like protein